MFFWGRVCMCSYFGTLVSFCVSFGRVEADIERAQLDPRR